ncbi:MAG: deoxyribonuclease IV [Ruminococcus sp.]|nr:deoxyribonuclease IV [Ruminococcus sp.]MDY3895199.1 deoxyribonuclease IV [Candidatus Fimenecus sp.]
MLHIGCHLSSSGGFYKMGETALKIGADTFQFFTRNPRGSKAKEINPDDAKKLLRLMEENRFPCILAHAPYTLNPCSANEDTRQFALDTMADDLKRMEFTPNQMYNFHPGSHTGLGTEKGIELTAEHLNKILTKEQTTVVLVETMAGKGTEIGKTFEEIRDIIDRVKLKDKVGVCLDTCHIFDAGYDIVNSLDGVLTEFDKTVGLKNLRAVHINDSKNPLGSHKDRHECIGKGYIGLDAMKRIVTHPILCHLPFYLETPNDLDGYRAEIELLRGFCDCRFDNDVLQSRESK